MDAPGEGAHKPLGRYVFNSVVYQRNEPFLPALREAGYEVRPHPTQETMVLVKFPVENTGVVFEDFHGTPVNLEPAVDQLNRYKLLMDHWCDQNCSLTVSYDPAEVPEIIDWMFQNWDSYVGVSWAFRTDPTKTAEDFGAAYLPQEVVDRETGGPVRVLEVVSVPAERDPAPRQPPPDALARFRAGLVFVVDTTVSMQPYIDRTREAMEGVVERLRQTAVRDNFRFGTVAFRDSQAAQPQGFEYVTRIHGLPDFGQPPEAALAAMRGVAATTVNNEGFDEDPVAGLLEALERVDWTPLGGRYVVLITDAGARDAADELSSTRLGLEQVRERAAQKGVTVFVIHLLTREGRLAGNHSRARRQYLSLTQGPAGELYYPVEDGAEEQFRATVSMLVEGLLRQVAETTGRPVAELRTRPATTPPSAERQRQAERMEQQLRVVGEAMRLAYLGREERTRAPDVVRSFVLDRDPAPPGNLGIEVRVMLTRNQLSDLTRTLEEILRAGRADRLDETAFFQQLQTALALAARDPTRIAQAGALGGLLGEFLEGLPYTSQIMGLTDREWRAMGASGQARLLNEIETKLRFYRYFSNDANLWRSLSGRPDAGEEVFPVPLSALP